MIKCKHNVPKLKNIFLQKYPKCRRVIEFFENANSCEFAWENISKARLINFVNYMAENVAPATTRTYSAKLKAIFSLYNDTLTIPKDYWDCLKIKNVGSQNIFLTEYELKLIINYKARHVGEQLIKNFFIISSLTGARHSDCINLTSSNICNNTLMYMSEKTNTDTRVPLSPAVKRLILENEKIVNHKKHYSIAYFNSVIRNICKSVGIDKEITVYKAGVEVTAPKYAFVSSHTARRSFATNLYLRGEDIYTISKLCGHSSTEMTNKYICCAPRVSRGSMKFFNEFK